MTEAGNLAAPIMRCAQASIATYTAVERKELQHSSAAIASETRRRRWRRSVHLEHVLRQIQTDRANLAMDASVQVTSTRHLGTSMPSRGRPPHHYHGATGTG